MSEKIKPLKPYPKARLTVDDGFKFGCGFFIAGFIFTLIALPVGAALVMIVLGLLAGLV
jgi:hypothetical protein